MSYGKLPSFPEPGDRFTLGECLGSGIDGTVYEAVDTKSGNMKVAIKIQKLRPDNESFISEEYRILKNFSEHPNLPKFYGAYKKEKHEHTEIWFAMEVSLFTNTSKLTVTLRIRLLSLKMENILLTLHVC